MGVALDGVGGARGLCQAEGACGARARPLPVHARQPPRLHRLHHQVPPFPGLEPERHAHLRVAPLRGVGADS
eukprot:2064980-Rhodomonas_salina.1